MSHSHHKTLRELLRRYEDGLTCKELSSYTGITTSSVRQSLEAMADAYIDRWTGPINGAFAAVWCVVVPPPNCPKPDGD